MLSKKFLTEMRSRAKTWMSERYGRAAERMGERKPAFETNAGIPVAPLYTPADLADQDYFASLGLPGEYPFTRGTYAVGYRSRYWQPNAYAGFGTGPDTNERLKFALSQGETALNLIMDVPTSYWGIDSDDPLAEGEVGRTGLAMNSIDDMADAFADIPIERISVTLNPTSVVVPSIYFAMAEERGIALRDLKGTCRNNPLVDYVSCNSGVMPAPQDALRELADFVAFTQEHTPNWHPFNIGSYEYRENGVTAVQELGFLFGNTIAYTDALIERGMAFDDFAPKYLFYTSVQTNLFEEVAKIRAARRMWAKLARDRYGAQNPASLLFRIHAQTSGFTLTAEEPLNNIARATIQGLAAVLGGTNSLYTDPYDEALCLPSELGLRTAMRTQQIIMEESGVADTIDPLGGSYYVESLTNAMEEGANEVLAEIESQGGMVKAIENGWASAESERSVAHYLSRVASGEHVVVGQNKYRTDEPVERSVFRIDPAFEQRQKDRLVKLRAERDDALVAERLEALRQAVREDHDMVRPCIEAAKARATFGEMTQAIYGEMKSFREDFRDLKLRMYA